MSDRVKLNVMRRRAIRQRLLALALSVLCTLGILAVAWHLQVRR